MGQAFTESINPYASPAPDNDPRPGSPMPQRAIVLRGQVDLDYELRVARRLRGRATQFVLGISAASMVVFSTAIVVQSLRLERWHLLPFALGPLLIMAFVLTWQPLLFAALKGVAWMSGRSWLRGRPIEFVADDQGLLVKDWNGEVFRRWQAFGRLQFVDDIVVLYSKGDAPLVVLSLHWCGSVSDQDALIALLRTKVGHATGGEQSCNRL